MKLGPKPRIPPKQAQDYWQVCDCGRSWKQKYSKGCRLCHSEWMTEFNKKNWSDPEYSKIQSESHKGYKFPASQRRNLSKAKKGRRFTEEHRKNMSKVRIGKKLSKEHCDAMSKCRKGRKLSKSHRLAISEGLKGRRVSKDTRSKISQALKGRTFEPETLKKMSESQTGLHEGDLNRQWRGGLSFLPYPSTFTKKLKDQIRQMYDHECQFCGKSVTSGLHVHHIDYDKQNTKRTNLVPLCVCCHSRTNFNRSVWIDYFREIVMGKAYAGK